MASKGVSAMPDGSVRAHDLLPQAKLLQLVANTGVGLMFPYAAISWRRTSLRTWASVRRMAERGRNWRRPQRARSRLQGSTRHVKILHGSENRANVARDSKASTRTGWAAVF